MVGDQHGRAVPARQRRGSVAAGRLVAGLLVLFRGAGRRYGGDRRRAVAAGPCPAGAAEDAVLVGAVGVRPPYAVGGGQRGLRFGGPVDDLGTAVVRFGQRYRHLGQRGQFAAGRLDLPGAAAVDAPAAGVRAVLALALGQQGGGDEDDGGGAAVRGGLERDPYALALGEAADHEQAEPVGVGQFELGGFGEPQVGVEEHVGGHAQAPVVDLQGEAVGDPLADHLDRGVRGREDGGVLQEFGDQVGEVGDRGALDGQPRQPAHLDALVVLHLGDRRAHHVHQLDGLAPLPRGGGAGEDHQALGVPPHAGGEVVEAEQVGQFLGVLGAPFHGVQQGQLAVQQDLAAAGEVDEDLGDAAAHVGLLDGGLDGGPLEGVERLADLLGLALAELQARRLGLDVDLFAGGQAAHDAGQPDAGDLVGGLAQPDQVPYVLAADADGDDDRDQQGDEAEDARDAGLEQDAHGDRLDAFLVAVAGLPAHALEVAEDLAGGGVPAFGVDGAGAAAGPAPMMRSS